MASFGQGVATLMIGRGLNGYYQFLGQFFGNPFFFSKIPREKYWRQSAPFINLFGSDNLQI